MSLSVPFVTDCAWAEPQGCSCAGTISKVVIVSDAHILDAEKRSNRKVDVSRQAANFLH